MINFATWILPVFSASYFIQSYFLCSHWAGTEDPLVDVPSGVVQFLQRYF
jgi:hypothetical protein